VKTDELCPMCNEPIDISDGYEEYHGDNYHYECVDEAMEEDRCAQIEAAQEMMHDPDYYLIDGVGFADPGGNSALRAETEDNPRNLPCPTCLEPNRLTPLDRARGYQCDSCADQAERGY